MAGSQTGDGTIGKALEVLDQVAAFGRPVRFSELLEHSSFPRATLYRLLQTLCSQGILSYAPDMKQYALGVRLVRLAHTAWQQSSLAPIARPHLKALSEKLTATVHLAQLDNGQVLYVDKMNAERPIEMFSQAGRVGPAYCTGIGKAMLAYVPEPELSRLIDQQSFHRFTDQTLTSELALRSELRTVRARGYGLDREEHEHGIICVALPIISRTGRVLGALSVTGSTSHTTLDRLETFAPLLRETAHRIAEESETWRFPDNVMEIRSTGT